MNEEKPKKWSVTMPVYTQTLSSENTNNQNKQEATNGKQ